MAKLTIRIDLPPLGAMGHGKIRLLELIQETGSISAAGRKFDMSYRRAWTLVCEINKLFVEPAVAARPGGRSGGGAALTSFGELLVASYRGMEAASNAAAEPYLAALERALARGAEDEG